MKKALYVSFLALIAISTASAAVSPYVGISGGLGFLSDSDLSGDGLNGELSYDAGYIIEGAVGCTLEDIPVRAEAALAFEQNDMDKFKQGGVTGNANENADLTTAMANAYYDFQTDTPLTPYVMAGLGWLHVNVDGDTGDHVAGQIGAGLGYEISDGVILDLKYKFFSSIGDVDVEGVDVEVSGQSIQIGARVAL